MDFVGIDKFSLLDYDEMVSIVLFAPKCNFRCQYCHNIQSVINAKESIPFAEIMEYLKTRVNVVDAVVISGGEPTLMDDLKDKIFAIKKLGFKIKLDTNGTNPTILGRLIDEKLIDYVAMDIKTTFAKYDLLTLAKVNIDLVKQSILLLKQNHIPYEFRTTLVEEFINEEDVYNIGKFLCGSEKLFLQKYVYREGVINKNLHQVSLTKANEFKDILSKYIKRVELRGY